MHIYHTISLVFLLPSCHIFSNSVRIFTILIENVFNYCYYISITSFRFIIKAIKSETSQTKQKSGNRFQELVVNRKQRKSYISNHHGYKADIPKLSYCKNRVSAMQRI